MDGKSSCFRIRIQAVYQKLAWKFHEGVQWMIVSVQQPNEEPPAHNSIILLVVLLEIPSLTSAVWAQWVFTPGPRPLFQRRSVFWSMN
jgi:hypothetical protein